MAKGDSPAVKVGSGYIEVVPRLTGLNTLRERLGKQFAQLGRSLGRETAKEFSETFVQTVIRQSFQRLKREGREHAEAAGKSIGTRMAASQNKAYLRTVRQGMSNLERVYSGFGLKASRAQSRVYRQELLKGLREAARDVRSAQTGMVRDSSSAGRSAGKAHSEAYTTWAGRGVRQAAVDHSTVQERMIVRSAMAGRASGLEFAGQYRNAASDFPGDLEGIAVRARAAGRRVRTGFFSEITRGLHEAAESMRQFGNRLQTYGQNWSLWLTAPFIAGVAAATRWGLVTGAEIQKTFIGLKRLLIETGQGSAKASFQAQSALAAIRKYATDTAFEFAPLANGVQRLVAAGLSAKTATHWIKTLGDTSAAYGAGADEMRRTIIALTQSMDAGRITAQDMNQLHNAGIPIWMILHDLYKKNRLELLAMARAGKLQSEDVWPKVIAHMEKFQGTGKRMAEAVPLENLKNELEKFKNSLSDVVNGTDAYMEGIDQASKHTRRGRDIQAELNKAFNLFGQVLQNLVPIFRQVLLAALPYVIKSLAKLNEWLTRLNKAGPDKQAFAGLFVLAAAALGPVMVGIGFVVRGMSSIVSSLRLISSSLGVLTDLTGKLGEAAKAAKNLASRTRDAAVNLGKRLSVANLVDAAWKLDRAFKNAIDNSRKRFSDLVKKIRNTPVTIKEKIASARDRVSNAKGVKGKTKAIGGIALGGLKGLLGVLGAIGSLVGRVLGPAFRVIGKILGPVLDKLGKAFVPLARALAKALGPGLAAAIAILTPALIALSPAFRDIGAAIGKMLQTAAPLAAEFIRKLAPYVNKIGEQLLKFLSSPAWGQFIEKLKPVADTLGRELMTAAEKMIPVFTDLMVALEPVLPALGVALASAVVTLIPVFTDLLIALLPLIEALVPLIALAARLTAWLLKLSAGVLVVAGAVTGWLIRKALAPAVRWLAAFVSWIVRAAAWTGRLAARIGGAFASAGRAVYNAGRAVVQGFWKGIQAAGGWLRRNIIGWLRQQVPGVMRRFLGIRSPSKVTAQIGSDTAAGLAAGIASGAGITRKASVRLAREITTALKKTLKQSSSEIGRTLNSLIGKVKDAFEGKRTSTDDRLIATLRSGNRKLQDLASKRQGILDKIKQAQDFARDTTGKAKEFASLGNLPVSASTPEGIKAGLASRLAQLREFGKAIGELAKRGLSKSLLRQVIEAGPKEGLAYVRSLLAADKATFSQINQLQSGIDAYSKAFGKDAADALYDSGKRAGEGFLAGLKAQAKAIEDLMAGIVKRLIAKVKKTLKISSPSQVMAQIGESMSLGLAQGASKAAPAAGKTVPVPVSPAGLPQAQQVRGEQARIGKAVDEGLARVRQLVIKTSSSNVKYWTIGQAKTEAVSRTGMARLGNQIFKPGLDTISNRFRSTWRTVDQRTGSGLNAVHRTAKNRLDSVAQTVKKTTSRAKDSWSSMVSAMNKATRSLVKLAYSRGVRGMVGAMAKLAGLKSNPLPPIAFSSGGIVPGYKPGRDEVPAVLSPGEGILRPEVVRDLGPQMIHEWNRNARLRGTAFARGGVVSGGDWVTRNQNKPYSGYAEAIKHGWKAAVRPVLNAIATTAGRFSQTGSGDVQAGYPWMRSWGRKLDKQAARGGSAAAIVNLAKKEWRSHPGDSNKYNRFSGADWCAYFLSYLTTKTRTRRAYWNVPPWFPGWGYVPTWLSAASGSRVSRANARPGDVGIYRGGMHVNLIAGRRGSDLVTIGGNESDTVRYSVRNDQSSIHRPRWNLIRNPGGPYVNPWPGSLGPDSPGYLGGGDLPPGGTPAKNKILGRVMNARAGWARYWGSLLNLWMRESGWNHLARNPRSGAYGIPQALPARKMASAGRDWRTNPRTQIRWGLGYIRNRYRNPGRAWAFWGRHHWYERGAWEIPRTQPAIVHKGEMILPAKQAEAFRRALAPGRKEESKPGGRTYNITLNAREVPSERAILRALAYADSMYR